MIPNNRSLYQSSLADFVHANASTILGHLVNAYHGNLQTTQTESWKDEIGILQDVLQPWVGIFVTKVAPIRPSAARYVLGAGS